MKDKTKSVDGTTAAAVVEVKDGQFHLVDPKHVKLGELADDLIKIRDDFGKKYVELCKWVRQNSISPVEVRQVLSSKGFNKSRISEVNRISQVPDDMWNEFEAGRLGRKLVLLMDSEVETVEQLAEGGTGGEALAEAGEAEAEANAAPSAELADEKKKLAMQRAAKYILNAAEYFNLRSKKFTLNHGWILELRKETSNEKKTREAKAEKKHASRKKPASVSQPDHSQESGAE